MDPQSAIPSANGRANGTGNGNGAASAPAGRDSSTAATSSGTAVSQPTSIEVIKAQLQQHQDKVASDAVKVDGSLDAVVNSQALGVNGIAGLADAAAIATPAQQVTPQVDAQVPSSTDHAGPALNGGSADEKVKSAQSHSVTLPPSATASAATESAPAAPDVNVPGTSNSHDKTEGMDIRADVPSVGARVADAAQTAPAVSVPQDASIKPSSSAILPGKDAGLSATKVDGPVSRMAEPKSNLAQQSAQAASTSALAPVTATVSVSATPSASATSTPAAVHARTSATPATPVAVAIGVGSSETPRSDAEPPNKRQRTQSDFDPSIIIGGDAGEIKLTLGQIKYAQNCIKALKGRTEARAFLAPVDPVLLGIPHYRNIITNPMDLGTVDIKLALTAAAAKGGNKPTEKVKLAPKWGLDPAKDVYTQVEEFERDVRLTFQNCRTFNGPQHAISQSADLLDGVFDKQMKSFPPADAPPPPEFLVDEKPSAGIPGAAGAAASGSGTSGGLAGNEQDRRISLDGRPKREVHPPPPRDIQYDEPQALKNKKKKKSRASMTPAEAMHWDKVAKEELKFCSKLIDDLLKPTHQDVAWVFYELPDRSYDFAPAYYAMIKKPISLMLIQRKVKNGQYVDGEEFDADMQLLFRNCFTFNPPGSDVALMGERLKETYEKLFMKKPEPKPFVEEESDEDEEPDEATVLAQALRQQIAMLTQQALDLEGGKPTAKMLAVAKGTLSTLGALPEVAALTAPVKKEAPKRRKSVGAADAPKKAKKPKKEASAPESAVKKSKKPKKSSNGGGGRLGSDEEDVRVVTYEQKEELAAKITELPDDRLEGALKIIAEDKPHSANDDEEIELDIDDLSAKTLYKLYRYVVRPKNKKTTNSNPAKNASDGRKRGTGGLKRKNLDEGEESERIRRLQAQLQQFEGGADGAPGTSQAHGHDDLVASESSGEEEDSDDSGSDY